jgi:predicted permease
MNWLSRLLRKQRQEKQLDAELRFHVEQQAADYVARGMSPAEARRRVAMEFGGLDQIKEECRDARGTRLVETLWKDIRFSGRMLRKSPGFATVAILTLALGIGANTAIFSLLYSVAFRNLPVPQPEELVRLEARAADDSFGGLSVPMFEEIAARQKCFTEVFGWWGDSVSNVEADGTLTRADIWAVTGNFQAQLGAMPELGRLIEPRDVDLHASSATTVAVLSYGFWQRRLGGDRSVVGKTIKVEGVPFTVIGVTRKGVTGMMAELSPDVTVPLTAEPLIVHGDGADVQKSLQRRDTLWIDAAGRLKPGSTLQQARAELTAAWPAIQDATIPVNPTAAMRARFLGLRLKVESGATGDSYLRRRFTQPLYLLLGIAGFVLLVACLNLASLMLARAAGRGHEISVRLALGASRWRVVRQILTESAMLSLLGTAAGLALAQWGSRALAHKIIGEIYIIPAELNLSPDLRILGFAAAVALLTGMLFGIAPIWRSGKEAPQAALQQASRVSSGTGRVGNVLIVSQVAVSLVLLAGAGLLIRTLTKLRNTDPGFRTERLFIVHLYPKPGGYKDLNWASYYRELTEHIGSLPGVAGAGVVHMEPGAIVHWTEQVRDQAGSQAKASDINMVDPGALAAMGVSVIGGRDFNWQDDEHAPHVAVVSRSFANQFFPQGSAIGQHIEVVTKPKWQSLEIVGVVSDASLYDLRQHAPPTVYLSGLQYGDYGGWGEMLVQTRNQPGLLENSLRQTVESQGHEYVSEIKTAAEQIDRGLLKERITALLSAFFGGLALLLAGIGLYGLMAYNVTRRTREIGIRMALGAQRGSVAALVLREALLLAAVGLAIGVPCALAGSKLIASMLYGVSARDGVTLASVSALLVAVAVVAGWIPARHAAQVDPMVALRCE